MNTSPKIVDCIAYATRDRDDLPASVYDTARAHVVTLLHSASHGDRSAAAWLDDVTAWLNRE